MMSARRGSGGGIAGGMVADGCGWGSGSTSGGSSSACDGLLGGGLEHSLFEPPDSRSVVASRIDQFAADRMNVGADIRQGGARLVLERHQLAADVRQLAPGFIAESIEVAAQRGKL